MRLIEKVREARFIYDKDHVDYASLRLKTEWFERTAKELGLSKYAELGLSIKHRLQKYLLH